MGLKMPRLKTKISANLVELENMLELAELKAKEMRDVLDKISKFELDVNVEMIEEDDK